MGVGRENNIHPLELWQGMLELDFQKRCKLPCAKFLQRNDTTTQQIKRFLGQTAGELEGSKKMLGIFLEHSKPLIFQNVIICLISPGKKKKNTPLGGICIGDIGTSVMKSVLCSKKGL